MDVDDNKQATLERIITKMQVLNNFEVLFSQNT